MELRVSSTQTTVPATVTGPVAVAGPVNGKGSEVVKEALGCVTSGENLSFETARLAMESMMKGEATPSQTAGLLVALRMKGETAEEIGGFAVAMRQGAIQISPSTRAGGPVDTCGTGGDRAGTFNISTTAAYIVAGAGVPVAKHGNRAVSSRCGSADVLEELGVRIDLDPERVEACIEEVGIGFLFAPNFHPAMRNVAGTRKELGIRTVFNILGPLANPAKTPYQVVGVSEPGLLVTVAEALSAVGVVRAFVVCGHGGVDELTTAGPADVCEVRDGRMREYLIDPSEYGFPPCSLDSLAGGDAKTSANILRSILEGKDRGPRRDTVLLNASAALVVAGKAGDLKEGIRLAEQSIDSGCALEVLNNHIRFSTELAQCETPGAAEVGGGLAK